MIICLDGNKIHYRNQKIVYQRELPPSRQQYNLLPVSKTNSDAPFSIRESPPKKITLNLVLFCKCNHIFTQIKSLSVILKKRVEASSPS